MISKLFLIQTIAIMNLAQPNGWSYGKPIMGINNPLTKNVLKLLWPGLVSRKEDFERTTLLRLLGPQCIAGFCNPYWPLHTETKCGGRLARLKFPITVSLHVL